MTDVTNDDRVTLVIMPAADAVWTILLVTQCNRPVAALGNLGASN